MNVPAYTLLYPAIDSRVHTPLGDGVLRFVHQGRAGVHLDGRDKLTLFDPVTIRPAGGAKVPVRARVESVKQEPPEVGPGGLWREM